MAGRQGLRGGPTRARTCGGAPAARGRAPVPAASALVLALQREAGNAAATALVQRRAAAPAVDPLAPTPVPDIGSIVPKPLQNPRPEKGKVVFEPAMDADIDWIPQVQAAPSLEDQIDLTYAADKKFGERLAGVAAAGTKLVRGYEAKERARVAKLEKAGRGAEAAEATTALEATLVELQTSVANVQQMETSTAEVGRIANRRTFMATMRSHFGSDDATKAHYLSLRRVGKAPDPKGGGLQNEHGLIHVTDPMATALEAVQAEMAEQGHAMPRTTVAQHLRARHLQGHPKGFMGHPFGLSIDYAPYSNPMLNGDRLALVRLLTDDKATVRLRERSKDGKLGDELTYNARRRAIEQNADLPPEQQDARFKDLLEQFSTEYDKVVAASATFQRSALTADKKQQLLQLRERHLALSTQLAQIPARLKAARGKSEEVAAIEAEQATLQASHEALKAELPTIFSDWVALVEAKRLAPLRAEAKAGGVDLDAWDPAQVGKAGQVLKAMGGKLSAGRMAALELKHADVLALVDALVPPGEARTMKARWAAYHRLKSFAGVKKQLAMWQGVQRSLTTDLTYTLGAVTKKAKGGGYEIAKQARDPAVAQVLELGYASEGLDVSKEGEGFDKAFFLSMMRHGFDPGVAWMNASDTMHFDYVPGFSTIVG